MARVKRKKLCCVCKRRRVEYLFWNEEPTCEPCWREAFNKRAEAENAAADKQFHKKLCEEFGSAKKRTAFVSFLEEKIKKLEQELEMIAEQEAGDSL